MDQMVARLNIEHFRHLLLVQETDETKRQMILRLLAEEEAKLAAMVKSAADSGPEESLTNNSDALQHFDAEPGRKGQEAGQRSIVAAVGPSQTRISAQSPGGS